MRICVLASGSSGNCTLVESDSARVLLDVGISWARVANALASIGVDPVSIDAIIVSHEHTDHVAGVGVAARKLRCPVYISFNTLTFAASRLKDVGREQIVLTDVGRPFSVNDIEFTAFPVPHDAVDPVGFTLKCNGLKVGIATDLGYPTNVVRHCLGACNALVLESNHDRRMLLSGPYPFELKQRIASRQGHLSNEQSADLLSKVIHKDLAFVFLSHLSEENNTPELAFNAAAEVLDKLSRRDVTLALTYRDHPSDVITIERGVT